MAWLIKNPKLCIVRKLPKNHEIMHENVKINAKRRVIYTYRLRERKTLQEIWRKTTKNLCGALSSRRERKKFWKVLKKFVWTSQIWFFKNLIHEFRLIETHRGSQKILMYTPILFERFNIKSNNVHTNFSI